MAEGEKVNLPQKSKIPGSRTEETKDPLADIHPAAAVQKTLASPGSLRSTDILQLQKAIGNRAVIQLLHKAGLINQPGPDIIAHPGSGSNNSNVIQAKLTIGDTNYSNTADVVKAFAADPNIGWDDRWQQTVESAIKEEQMFQFADLKRFETFLMDAVFPRASIDQPNKKEDAVKSRLCFVYSTLAAGEISGKNSKGLEDQCVEDSKYSMGGGPSKTLKTMGLSPETTRDKKRFKEIIDKGMDEQGFATQGPLMAGVNWKRGKTKGQHWVYIVGKSGKNKIHVRDQQNKHVLGTIDLDTCEGSSSDEVFQYELTQVSIGIEKPD